MAALIEEKKLKPNLGVVSDILESAASEIQVSLEVAKKSLGATSNGAENLAILGLRLAALEFVMSQVSFELIEET